MKKITIPLGIVLLTVFSGCSEREEDFPLKKTETNKIEKDQLKVSRKKGIDSLQTNGELPQA